MVSDELLQEIDAGEGLPLSALAKRVPRTRLNRPVTISCLVRWILEGARAPGHGRVKLEAVRLSGRWISSAKALRRFILRQTPGAEQPEPVRSPAKRRARAEKAERELEAMGV